MIIFNHIPTAQDIQLICEWRELTLEQAIKIKAVELPDVADTFEWFEHLDKVKQLWQIFTRSKVDIETISPSELVHYFVKYILPMVQDLNAEYPKTYNPVLMHAFKHKGIRYNMPTSLQVGEEVILSHGQRARRFTEASNLLKVYSQLGRQGLTIMAQFVASVVNEKEGEEWSETRIIARGEAFKDLPMDIVWEVFFCISGHLYRQLSDTINYLKVNPTLKPKEGQSSITYYLKLRRAVLLERLKALTA
jgi:hypothetical protein